LGQNRKGKGKGKQTGGQGHSHVASIAIIGLPPTHIATDPSPFLPTTHSVMHIGPSGSVTRTVQESPLVESSLGFYPLVNKAISLAERMNVPATVQTVKMLEQRFTKFYAQVHPRIEDFMGEESDDDLDINMSQTLVSRQPILKIGAVSRLMLWDLILIV
jgi:hypothetical protein